MTLTDIKKELYKQNPKANLIHILDGSAYYSAGLNHRVSPDEEYRVLFEVPILDMGSTSFKPTMEAKHLIRWIIINLSSEI
jgi:hypothetical protein